MWQEIVVYIVVACAGVYAMWRWMPNGLRRKLGWKTAQGCGNGCDTGSCSACPSQKATPTITSTTRDGGSTT